MKINEKAVSQKQQKFMGMVHAAQKGKLKHPSKAVKKAAKSISKKAAHDFAATPTQGLPKKISESIAPQSAVETKIQQMPTQEQVPSFSPKMKVEFHKLIGEYNKYGQVLKRAGSLREMAKKMTALAELAEKTIMAEADDWFDAHTIKRNMKELKSYAGEFGKFATEADQVMERVTALYDDMGRVLERYFEIYDVNENIAVSSIAKDKKTNEGVSDYQSTDKTPKAWHIGVVNGKDTWGAKNKYGYSRYYNGSDAQQKANEFSKGDFKSSKVKEASINSYYKDLEKEDDIEDQKKAHSKRWPTDATVRMAQKQTRNIKSKNEDLSAVFILHRALKDPERRKSIQQAVSILRNKTTHTPEEIKLAKQALKDAQMANVWGETIRYLENIDAPTYKAIQIMYENLSENNKKKFFELSIPEIKKLAWKIIN